MEEDYSSPGLRKSPHYSSATIAIPSASARSNRSLLNNSSPVAPQSRSFDLDSKSPSPPVKRLRQNPSSTATPPPSSSSSVSIAGTVPVGAGNQSNAIQVTDKLPDDELTALRSRWIGRSHEIESLWKWLLSHDRQSCLLVEGGASTGKTSVVLDTIKSLQLEYAYVNSAECNPAKNHVRDLFGIIARQLPSSSLSSNKGRDTTTKVKSKTVDTLRICMESTLSPDRTTSFIIVIDGADDPEFLSAITAVQWAELKSLQEHSHRKIRLIFIARAHDSGDDDCHPSIRRRLFNDRALIFDSYTPEVLRRILASSVPTPEDQKDFKQFLKTVFPRLYPNVCTELDDITYVVRYLWQCVNTKGEGLAANVMKTLAPTQEILTRRVFHRDAEAFESFKRQLDKEHTSQADIPKKLDAFSDREVVGAAELPYYGKVLLLASYLASYNHPDHDAILYGAKKKRSKPRQSTKTKAPAQQSQRIAGPKPFTLERVRWLFKALLTDLKGSDQAEKASFGLQRYMESLSSLRLVGRCTDEAELNDIKFTCLASHSFCEAVTRNLGLELSKYLAENAL